ncbi:MAG TPA: hypothetical protein VKX17_15590 [Planctomycetota bacterium]|nr:hypothetical protein [Planctomycetota bacterium]
MRIAKFMAPLVLAFICWSGAQAAEKSDGTKFSGTLGAKAADAKPEVLGTLTVKGKGANAESKTYTLTADGDVAKSVTELVAKSAKVQVVGTATGDVIKVTTITEKAAKPAK